MAVFQPNGMVAGKGVGLVGMRFCSPVDFSGVFCHGVLLSIDLFYTHDFRFQ
ncbi:MAG: hypothetical protein RLZZ537_1805 [Pseudomonadota bacterium]